MAAILQRSQSYAFSRKDTRSVSTKLHSGVEQQLPLDASSRSKSALLPLRERKALTQIYPNTRPLRKLPSRMAPAVHRHISTASRGRGRFDEELEKDSAYLVTRKRKRGLLSGNENVDNSSQGAGVNSGGSGSRASLKRQRSLADPSSSRTDSSRMDVDEGSQGGSLPPLSDQDDVSRSSDEQMEDTAELDTSDEFNLYEAQQWQLQKLRKDELVNLHLLAELNSESEVAGLTKVELINGILELRSNRQLDSSRTSVSSTARSQRRSNGASPSSSHTDGNDAGAEDSGSETGSVRKRARLRRRATDQQSATTAPGTNRNGLSKSKSMGFIQATAGINRTGGSLDRHARIAPDVKSPAKGLQRRQRSVQSSYRSSPSSPAGTDGSLPPVFSPRHTRSHQSKSDNGKHVEFSEADGEETDEDGDLEAEDAWVDCDVRTQNSLSSKQSLGRSISTRGVRKAGLERQSSLLSPRKLRARPTRTASISSVISSKPPQPAQPLRRQRSRPQLARKAKTGESLKEEEESSGEVDDAEEPTSPSGLTQEVDELSIVAEDEAVAEDDEQAETDEQMDELTEEEEEEGGEEEGEEAEADVDGAEEEEPPRVKTRRTRSRIITSTGSMSTRQRLRAARSQPIESFLTDEDFAREDEFALKQLAAAEDDEAIEDEPRVLRNGKVVGEVGEADEEDAVDEVEEEVEEDVEEEDQLQEDGEDEDTEEMEDATEEIEVDEDEESSEELDLSEATAKSLTRLRRDDLVRLCETRDLDVDGTKNQLVHNLLIWRDQHASTPPSSTQASSRASTVRAPSTPRPGRNGSPVLLRSDRVHVEQPNTPDPDHPSRSQRHDSRNKDEELDVDLESLGLEDREIPADKLVKLEKIGSGGFKDVYIGKLRGRKVAIAEFRGQLSSMDIKELKLLRDFDHPNVVRFLGVSIPENTRETQVMMVSELCTNGDLFDYVRNVPPPTLRKVLNLMLDIARGIQYLHLRKPSVIHRDCKSSNILITSKVSAKIADFGLAKVKQSTRSMVKSLVGTVNWQAPELWHAHPKYDYKVDVFSCAMVFWEMLQWHVPHKKYPWEGMNEHAIYEEVGAKKHRPSITGLRKQWCSEVVDLVEKMWAQDPRDRPTISQVVDELETMIADL